MKFEKPRMSIYLNISEDIVSLWSKIVLHESLLTSTIPQVEYKIAKQPHMGVLNINGGSQSPGVSGYEVGKDDGPHAGLARARFAHQQHLFTIHFLRNESARNKTTQ